MAGLGGDPAVYGLESLGQTFRLLLAIAAVGALAHAAARMVLGRSTLAEGLATAFLAVFSAILLHGLVGNALLAYTLTLAAFVLVVRITYRTKWPQAAAVGAVAWVLWNLLGWLLRQVVGAMR